MTKKTKRKRKKKVDHDTKQFVWVIVVIAVIFISFLIPYFYAQSLKKFGYLGLDWTIEKESSSLTFYHARVPKNYNGQFYGYHNVYLRNDPRENNISADVNISFYSRVRVSQSPEVLECSNEVLVSSGLGQITALFPFIDDVEGTLSDEKTAKEWNLPFANCTSEKDTTVILVQMGNESSVTQEGDDCFVLTFGKCEDNMIVSEKFIIEILDQLNFQQKE